MPLRGTTKQENGSDRSFQRDPEQDAIFSELKVPYFHPKLQSFRQDMLSSNDMLFLGKTIWHMVCLT